MLGHMLQTHTIWTRKKLKRMPPPTPRSPFRIVSPLPPSFNNTCGCHIWPEFGCAKLSRRIANIGTQNSTKSHCCNPQIAALVKLWMVQKSSTSQYIDFPHYSYTGFYSASQVIRDFFHQQNLSKYIDLHYLTPRIVCLIILYPRRVLYWKLCSRLTNSWS